MSQLAGTTISMKVKHMALGASGGSYVVNYQADITLTEQTAIEVEVVTVYPMPRNIKTEFGDIQRAQQAIQKGCVEVLTPINCGARVAITDLVIHPIDFKPERYAYWTAIDLQQHLNELSSHSV